MAPTEVFSGAADIGPISGQVSHPQGFFVLRKLGQNDFIWLCGWDGAAIYAAKRGLLRLAVNHW
jgi:hypothetical protein